MIENMIVILDTHWICFIYLMCHCL